MTDSQILDSRGKPFKKKALTEELAFPSMTGIRSAWGYGSMADGLTPKRLAEILRSANDGNETDYLTLAEEMEEREPHYASVLGTRKRGVSGLEPTVEAASEDAHDVKLADDVRENLVETPEFGELVDDLLDALGKGRSTVEIIWDTSASQWKPADYKWRDPRYFVPARDDPHVLRLLDDENPSEGIELAPYKFINHHPRLKTGIPIRGGVARPVAVSYMSKSYGWSDWMAFAEVYGQPIRVGRYGTNASNADKKILKTAVANIGSDAAAILPDSMRLEFIEAAKGGSGGDAMFKNLVEWLDKQTSKVVIGQTASAEGTPGSLGGQDGQEDVRDDIKKADAKALKNTINRTLIRPYIDLNHGPQERYPQVDIPVPEAEDLALLATALKELVPLKINAPAKWARDKFGIPDAKEGDELLGAVMNDGGTTPGKGEVEPSLERRPRATQDAKAEAEPSSTEPKANEAAALNHAAHCPACSTLALNRSTQDPDASRDGGSRATQDAKADDVDELEREALNNWVEQVKPMIDPVQQLANEAQDEHEFLARLPELIDQMDSQELVKKLALQTYKARALGDAREGEV